MDVSCGNCQARFKIPDEKVPQNQVFGIACPKCKEKISIDTRAGTPPAPSKPVEKKPSTLADEVSSGSYDAADRPFDFLEEGVETALVCEPDDSLREKITGVLESMGYHITTPKNAREVLKQMRFHIFDMLVINEMFDTPSPDQNNILRYLERLGMEDRRNMFVVLITDRFRTEDNMAAFNKSVNITVNISNVDKFDKVLEKGLKDNAAFYKVFKEALIKAGKA